MSQELRILFSSTLKKWLKEKVPYEHRGMTRNGCDCSGLVIGVLREMGYLTNYSLRSYPPDWNLHSGAGNYIVQELKKFANRTDKPTIGDIVVFHFGRCVAHVGVIVEHGLFIHCFKTSKTCIVSSLNNSPWAKRIAGFYSIDWDRLQ